jgi:hypothetical protein
MSENGRLDAAISRIMREIAARKWAGRFARGTSSFLIRRSRIDRGAGTLKAKGNFLIKTIDHLWDLQ